MYVIAIPIKNKNYLETYFYRQKNGKPQVFTFNTEQTAAQCIKLFQNYAIETLVKESGDPFSFGQIMSFCSSFEIKELPKMDAEKISFEELMKEKGYEI